MSRMKLPKMDVEFEVKKPFEEYQSRFHVKTEGGCWGGMWGPSVMPEGDDLSGMSWDTLLDILLRQVGEVIKAAVHEVDRVRKGEWP